MREKVVAVSITMVKDFNAYQLKKVKLFAEVPYNY